MKTLILSLAIVLQLSFTQAQEKGVTITIIIDNIISDEGMVLASVHTQETFMKGAGIINSESEITNGAVTLTFENVAPGTYAIMAMHDKNNNNRMDFDLNGMPKESYGISGNDMSFGPPTFGTAKFEVTDSDIEMNIRF